MVGSVGGCWAIAATAGATAEAIKARAWGRKGWGRQATTDPRVRDKRDIRFLTVNGLINR